MGTKFTKYFGNEENSNWVSSYESMLNLMPGLVAYFDRELRYLYANEKYIEWRGLSPQEIIGKHCSEVVGSENYPLISVKLREALAGSAVTYEYDLFDGEFSRRVQGNYVPEFDGAGNVSGVLILVTDISARHDLQSRIAESEAVFDDAFENAPIGKAMADPEGRLLRSNAAFAAMMGRTVIDLVGMNFRDLTHPDDVNKENDLFKEVLDGARDGYRIEKRYLRKDGAIVPAALAVSVSRDRAGRAKRFIAHIADVSERVAAERKLEEANTRLSLALDAVRGGFWHLDIAGGQFVTSPQLSNFITGNEAPLDLEGYAGKIHLEDIGNADLTSLIDGTVDRSSMQYRLETVTGTHWMRCDRRLLRDAHGQPLQIVGVTIDITEEHRQQARYRTEADTDALTGVLNRRGLARRFHSLGVSRVTGVLAIDLDRFKETNDRFGHKAGDAVLAEVSRRILTETRRDDLVARIGGDEFVVVVLDAAPDTLTALAARLSLSLSEPFEASGQILPISGSVGAAGIGSEPCDLDAMLARADAALYTVKSSGRGHWRLAQ